MRVLVYGQKLKGYERKYKGRYFVIATGLGYLLAKKMGFSEKEAKALGYAFALMPNVLRNSLKWGIGINNGVFTSKPRLWGDNDDKMLEQGLIDKMKYVNLGSFTFGVVDGKVFSPKMRNLIYWDEYHFDLQMAKLSPKQREKMFGFLEKELKELNLSVEELNYKIAKHWDTFVQIIFEKCGDVIYQ